MSSDDSSWEFKVEAPREKPDRPQKKKTAVTQEKKKRRRETSDLLEKGREVKVEQRVIGKRKSRSQLAKDYEREEDKRVAPHPHELYGSLMRRGVATVIDLGLVASIAMAILTFQAELWIQIEMVVFGLNDFGQGPLLTYFGSLAVFVYLVFSVAPSIVFGRTFGKAMAGVKIYGKELLPLGYLKTFLREILLKPLSALSLIGLFMCYFSKKRRMLHDHIVGSTVRRQ